MSRRWRNDIACSMVVLSLSAIVWAACGGSDPPETAPASTSASTTTAPAEDFQAEASDFRHLETMTKVRGFFVDNRLDHLGAALAIARADEGGVYPVGTIIQLVPQEAMVKRRAGWSPATKDWEFFFLEVSAEGTVIEARGRDDVVNRFGGNCAACHAAAEPKFDFVCEDDHGCDPLPIGDDIIQAVQAADPRPR